jgi:hypothetical protein
MLIVFAPIGIVLVWLHPSWGKVAKMGLTLFGLVCFGTALTNNREGGTVSPSSDSAAIAPSSAPQPPVTPSEPEAAPPAAQEVSSSELYSAYNSNEVAADEQYKDKQVKVTGEVESIGKDLMDTMYVSLKGDVHRSGPVHVR